ncbi:hypothetical protein [Mesorhizobium sp.]|uniref:hypothetical protein n=1 Tax=Mesorhizobium sp. TaxID=1871066 RepID=UPI001217D034|nr:hypothetical protein [Mesorhizobium sp.]TIW97726.1 MAG: hypothetical protein E5V45_15160 [Mesorhizobium sp.]
MTAVIVRIALRYGAGVLVARGLLGSDDASAFSTDPDVQMALETGLGLAIGGGTEAWHWMARRFGWEH